MKIEKILQAGAFLIFPILFFCTTVDFSDIDDLVQGPKITIPGDNPDTVNVGDSWNEPTAIAMDATDGDISSSVETDGSVNTDSEGVYKIIYTVTNSKDVTTTDTLIVVVIDDGGSEDKTAPEITIPGDNPDTITVGDNWSEPAVTANDNKDGDLTTSIVKTGEVKTGTVGTYEIIFTVKDAAGNEASKTLKVVVIEKTVDDKVKPVITITGDNPDTINVGDDWTKPTVTANDDVDGDLTSELVESGSVDNTKAGKNTLTWTVSDAAGNEASESWVLIVKDTSTVDNDAPVITIPGNNPDTTTVGSDWTEPNVTAYDGKDGDLTNSMTKTGSVDKSKAGTYTITWSVSDAAGNDTSETLTVVVKEEVVTGDSLLIEDFETGELSQITLWNGVNYDDGWWYGWVGESSKLEPETTDSINMDKKVADSAAHNGSKGMYAKITLEGIAYPSGMVGFSLKTADQYYDISSLESVTLYMKGSGKINVYFGTKHVNDLGDDAWGHYGMDVNLTNTWEKITITKDNLKASTDNPKITKTWAEASTEVTSMGFEVTGGQTETGGTVVEVYIDDIWFHGITKIE